MMLRDMLGHLFTDEAIKSYQETIDRYVSNTCSHVVKCSEICTPHLSEKAWNRGVFYFFFNVLHTKFYQN